MGEMYRGYLGIMILNSPGGSTMQWAAARFFCARHIGLPVNFAWLYFI